MNLLWEYDVSLKNTEYDYIIGIDEVGRGAIASFIVGCAVILHPEAAFLKINDSKKLSASSRENLYNQIINHCMFYHFEMLSANYIDTYGIQIANKNVLKRSMDAISHKVNGKILTLADGNPLWSEKDLIWETHADSKSLSVAAASILAKVFRDRILIDLGDEYPEYFFQQHKGYGTSIHKDAIRKYGLIQDIHRNSFTKDLQNYGKNKY